MNLNDIKSVYFVGIGGIGMSDHECIDCRWI